MSYEVITPTDVRASTRTFQIIQADFRKIGVQLRQKALDSSAAFDAITAPNGKYLNFDLSMWDWVALVDPDFMLSVVTCDQYNGWSDTGFCDKKYDKMYSQQQLTPDQASAARSSGRCRSTSTTSGRTCGSRPRTHVSATNKKWTGLVQSPAGPLQRALQAQPDAGAPVVTLHPPDRRQSQ